MQIGKSYPYREGLRPESWRLVEALKKTVDPEGRVNPGSLGLD
jgi:FAD/FMN-containing dehydrogenase